jgi:putative peptidoglycan binding protein/transglycosylase-like protein with SLT domain
MSHPVLRLNDGFTHTSPELRDEVKELQDLLNQHGFNLDADGRFGADTEAAVKQFQSEHSLDDDGVVGALTWAALEGSEQPDVSTIFPTTLPRNDSSLLKQLDEAIKYKSFIDAAAERFGIRPSVIGGVGSRESNWGLILRPAGPAGTGDFGKRRAKPPLRPGQLPPDGGGFGRGLMQIDFDAFPFARSEDWKDPEKNINFGCQVLSDNVNFMQRKTSLKDMELLRAALAAYNSGPGNVLTAIRSGRDVDFFTAHRDYSKDVVNRAGWFQLQGWD